MSEIYQSASAVYAWLGPPSEDSNLAMNLLHRIGESIDLDEASYEIRPRESSYTRESPMSEGGASPPGLVLPPAVEVYKDLVLAEMEATGRADLLSECFLSADESAARDWQPSWVPNWSVKREKGLSMNQVCADGQSSVTGGWSVDAGVLQIKGMLVDKVMTATPTPKLTVDTTKSRDKTVPPIIGLASSRQSALHSACPRMAFSGGGHFRDHLSDGIAASSIPSVTRAYDPVPRDKYTPQPTLA
ncbi:hypothetical protein QBC35DRAFT_550543 [Podospora australis]|uniref:Heterokaryon incompatibility domain-containing protein n=1 Tax=Podospora australis TaxID=1536484 RepID=A0AAN6WKJ1_9PEZI|nr:hypothetical protein QBC35DRAFT_550543 [Podospora australis]